MPRDILFSAKRTKAYPSATLGMTIFWDFIGVYRRPSAVSKKLVQDIRKLSTSPYTSALSQHLNQRIKNRIANIFHLTYTGNPRVLRRIGRT